MHILFSLNNLIFSFLSSGSYQCRVGWANSEKPLMIFRNLIAKPRKDRIKKDGTEILVTPPTQIGNDIVNIEAMRFQLKTQVCGILEFNFILGKF